MCSFFFRKNNARSLKLTVRGKGPLRERVPIREGIFRKVTKNCLSKAEEKTVAERLNSCGILVVNAKQKSEATFVYLLAKINGLMSVNILLSHPMGLHVLLVKMFPELSK